MGSPKGLLPDANGVPLLARWIGLADAVGLVPCVVGDAAPYAALLAELERKRGAPITRIVDSPAGVGPLGGLRAVLAHAGDATVVVVACDMPAVRVEDLTALRSAPVGRSSAPDPAAVVSQRIDGEGRATWEPFFARYEARASLAVVDALLATGERALFRVAEALRAVPWHPDPRCFVDWDVPDDLPGGAPPGGGPMPGADRPGS